MDSLQLSRSPFLKQLKQQLEAPPPSTTEESLLLRTMVQTLVAVGIVATDVAAGTQTSLWAIPLSLAGGFWSWTSRRKRNVATKFLISIGMLLAMAAFFGNIFASLNDTRLVLAELLIQLQILHSFHMPRRKDLGYSMVIGLILLGVAGTLSETLAFAPLLLVFLAIAIPVLVLDYRSRLGFVDGLPSLFGGGQKASANPTRISRKYSALSPKQLFLLLLGSLALGLTIFALMPRFPGYQQFTFPVSGAAELEDARFSGENRGILNPGVREGEGGADNAENGSGELDGEGEGDGDIYYGFRSEMDQGASSQMGGLTPKVVFRVRSQAPGFWRVLGFDRYTGRGWEISRDDQLLDVQRPPWSYQFYLSSPYGQGRTRQVIQTYTVVSPLPNLVPALSHAKMLYFPTPEVALDPEGSIRAPATLNEDLSYTVISEVAYRDRTALGNASVDYPKYITDYYLQVPPRIKERVRQKAEELLAKSPKPITSPYETALYLAQALKQNYQIQLGIPPLGENDDLVEAFLFRNEGGYADHFSTVLTVMLRSLDIPARLAAGYGTGEFNPFTGFYVVKNTDAFALVEVFFPDYGWFTFDPIPGNPLMPPSFEEYEAFGVLRQFWNWVAGWLPTPVTSFFNLLWQGFAIAIATVVGWLWGLVSSSLLGFMTGLILLVGVSFLGWIAWVNFQRWRYQRRLAKLPAMEKLYQQMLDLLAVRGEMKHPAQTPLEYARIARSQLSDAAAEIIEEISTAYVRWRYGEEVQNTSYLQEQLKALARSFQRLGKKEARSR
ncbi:MAG: transglutaminaseTgpA domain-containing protein [Cyanobacteriota bacterium]|nr:transglutaminaseTgpA domain-containing protein [Cyanobacteriota bacterium]